MDKFIYADNAATTRLDENAFEAMKPYLLNNYGNASQPYTIGNEAHKAIQKSRQIIAECIGANSDEVFFTSCGTESNNWAIKGSIEKNKQIATSVIEHHAILNPCSSVERNGIKVSYIPVTNSGLVLTESLNESLSVDTSLVSIMLANNEIGSIQNISELAALSHSHGAYFHTDAVQAVGHIKVDVRELGVDLLSASAHKFNGPKGIGFLYIKEGTPIKQLIDGGSQEHGLRAGTENVASIVGMAVALKANIDNLENNAKHILNLEKRLLNQLYESNIDFIRNGSDKHIPGNISLSFKNHDGEKILHRLDLRKIYISTGSACDSVNTQVSHVIKALGIDESYAKGTIRISLGKYNTVEEIDIIAAELINILCAKR